MNHGSTKWRFSDVIRWITLFIQVAINIVSQKITKNWRVPAATTNARPTRGPNPTAAATKPAGRCQQKDIHAGSFMLISPVLFPKIETIQQSDASADIASRSGTTTHFNSIFMSFLSSPGCVLTMHIRSREKIQIPVRHRMFLLNLMSLSTTALGFLFLPESPAPTALDAPRGEVW